VKFIYNSKTFKLQPRNVLSLLSQISEVKQKAVTIEGMRYEYPSIIPSGLASQSVAAIERTVLKGSSVCCFYRIVVISETFIWSTY